MEPAKPQGPAEDPVEADALTEARERMFARLASFGPGLVTYLLLTGMMRPQEREYLDDLGVAPRDLSRVQSAIWVQGSTFLLWGIALIAVPLGFNAPGLGPALLPNIPHGIVLIATIPALLATIMSSAPRDRLLASAARCTRLLCALAPPTPRAGLDLVFARRLKSPTYRRRRVAAVAWALTRDTARLTGQPVSAGATVGELLLWFDENPADRRRRPIVGAYLAELVAAAARETAIPHAQFAPAARFRTRSPREAAARRLRAAATSPLATGVFLAVVATLLRVWLK